MASSTKKEVYLEYQGNKIKTNLKLKEFIRLLYIFIKENEELAETFYNFTHYKKIFNFIKNHVIIFEASKTRGKNTKHPTQINQDTARKYYDQIISDADEYQKWKEYDYNNKFFEVFKELHFSNQF